MSCPLSEEFYQTLNIIFQGMNIKAVFWSQIYEIERPIESKAKRTEKR